LAMENNPNVIELLFTPENCVIHSTEISKLVRKNRSIFLHKGVYHKMVGYAKSQLHKCLTKNPENGSKRQAIVDKYGFDVKFSSHIVRLTSQLEQLLTLSDMDLQDPSRIALVKQIRNGEVTFRDIQKYFEQKLKDLEQLYLTSKLPEWPDEVKIKKLLLQCIESFHNV